MASSRAGGFRSYLLSGEGLTGAAILVAFLYLTSIQAILNDGDTSWHIAAGRLILATQSVPETDPFSFTFAGHAWTAHEWAAEVLIALVFDAGGWAAVTSLFAAVFAIALTLLARELLRSLPARYAFLSLALVAGTLAPFTLARPHVLTWPILILWVLTLLQARDRHSAPPWGHAGIMILWANLHASFFVGLGLAAIFALEAVVQEKKRGSAIAGWGAFGVLSALLAFATPHGIQGFLYPLQVSSMKTLPLIQEWRASRLPEDFLFFVLVGASGLLAILRRRELGPVRLVLLAGLALMAFLHSRHQPVFAIVAALLVPRGVYIAHERANAGKLAWLVPVIVVVALARSIVSFERRDGATYPATAIAAVPPGLRKQPMLNSYSFGGPLILNGIRPYIDGRADMYGDGFTADHSAIILGDTAEFDRSVRRFGIRWTILQPGSPLVHALDQDRRWRRIYSDRWAVMHVRS